MKNQFSPTNSFAILFIILLVIPITFAGLLTTFEAGTTSDINITFTENSNDSTYYFSLPKEANVTYATLNITGHNTTIADFISSDYYNDVGQSGSGQVETNGMGFFNGEDHFFVYGDRGNANVIIVNVTNSSSPQVLENTSSAGKCRGLSILNDSNQDWWLITGGESAIIAMNNITNGSIVNDFAYSATTDVYYPYAINDTRLYSFGLLLSNFTIFNTTNKSAIHVINSSTIGGTANNAYGPMCFKEGIVYGVGHIVNTTDDAITEINSSFTMGRDCRLSKDEETLFTQNRIYNISNPAEPVILFSGTFGTEIGMHIEEDIDRAYFKSDNNLQIWDISDLTAPTKLKDVTIPNSGEDGGLYYQDGYTFTSHIHAPGADNLITYSQFDVLNHTKNPYLEIGTPDGSYEWNESVDEFITINTTDDFAASLNSALNNENCDCTGCSIISNMCRIPILASSETAGKLTLDSLNITYDAIDFSPNSKTDAITQSNNKSFILNISNPENEGNEYNLSLIQDDETNISISVNESWYNLSSEEDWLVNVTYNASTNADNTTFYPNISVVKQNTSYEKIFELQIAISGSVADVEGTPTTYSVTMYSGSSSTQLHTLSNSGDRTANYYNITCIGGGSSYISLNESSFDVTTTENYSLGIVFAPASVISSAGTCTMEFNATAEGGIDTASFSYTLIATTPTTTVPSPGGGKTIIINETYEPCGDGICDKELGENDIFSPNYCSPDCATPLAGIESSRTAQVFVGILAGAFIYTNITNGKKKKFPKFMDRFRKKNKEDKTYIV